MGKGLWEAKPFKINCILKIWNVYERKPLLIPVPMIRILRNAFLTYKLYLKETSITILGKYFDLNFSVPQSV